MQSVAAERRASCSQTGCVCDGKYFLQRECLCVCEGASVLHVQGGRLLKPWTLLRMLFLGEAQSQFVGGHSRPCIRSCSPALLLQSPTSFKANRRVRYTIPMLAMGRGGEQLRVLTFWGSSDRESESDSESELSE